MDMSLEERLENLEHQIKHLHGAVGPDFVSIKDAGKVSMELKTIIKQYDGKLERLEKIIEENSRKVSASNNNQKFVEIEQRITKLLLQQEELRQQPKLDQVFSEHLRKSSELVDLKTQLKKAKDQINTQEKIINNLQSSLNNNNNELKELLHSNKESDLKSSLDSFQKYQTNFDNKLTKLQKDYTQQQREIQENQKQQESYNKIEASILRLTEHVNHLQAFQKAYDQKNWSIDDAIDKKLDQYYSKLELNKKVTSTIEELNNTINTKLKDIFDEWFERIMALENRHTEFENLQDKVQLLEPLKSLFEDHVTENAQWREQSNNQEKVIYQNFTDFKEEVKIELTKLNNNIADRLKPISKFEVTIKDIENEIISLRSNSATKRLKESTEQDLNRDEEITTVTLDAHILEVKELIKNELDKVKTEWLDSISTSILSNKRIAAPHENIITAARIREELNNLLTEAPIHSRITVLLRENIDDALKLPLNKVDKVEQYLEKELKTVARKEDYTGFDNLFDDLSHRINSIEGLIENLRKDLTSVPIVDQEIPQEFKKKNERSDSDILWEQLIYYTSQPNIDDVFIQSKVSTTFKRGKTIYQIKLNSKEATEAELWLVNDHETLKVAHNAPDTYLTACEFQSTDIKQLNPSNTRPGKVKWDGKNWKLLERILVY